MSDFLNKLQALKFQTEENSWKKLKRSGRVFFRLEKTEKGVALSVVDEKGILVDVDSRYYEPEESVALSIYSGSVSFALYGKKRTSR